MKVLKSTLLAVAFCLLTAFSASAQRNVKALLVDETSGDPIGFATVSLTKKGQEKAYKYILSNEAGKVQLENVRKGSYEFKAEFLGYVPLKLELTVEDKPVDLGTLKMKLDQEQLDAAKVTALGNPIIVKKDTIEYNASSFKTTENDVLEDLLKKLPGVEVSEDGSITVNGQSINKITIDGKTFFLDDPQLASKNIPAKIVNKVKVIDKKSEQAEFTGIDDGQEETVIDLSIKPGMMNGTFGNVMAGAGHDVPSSSGISGDYRYQGAAFAGKFTDKTQISLVLNGNNTNNRGFNDLAGSMMQGMRGGGMGRGQGGWGSGNGITTSYMGGINAASEFFNDRMDLGGNYLYNHTDKEVEESSRKTTYLDNRDLIYSSDGTSSNVSDGHRFGLRLEHKFSDNTSLIFEPQVNFGGGNYLENSTYSTITDYHTGESENTNSGKSLSSGANNNINTSGMALLRQRLGKPGRTLTIMTRYSFSNNKLGGDNYSLTTAGGKESLINQTFESVANSSSVTATLTYTEPLAERLFLEGNYSYSWSDSKSEKTTTDNTTGLIDYTYSNRINNSYKRHDAGFNILYQTEKFRAQAGLAILPTHTYNSTTKYDATTGQFEPMTYTSDVLNWSPRVMLFGDLSDNLSGRMFYNGTSSQPSTSQLMPVPDISNPLAISFGNPNLIPYFSHQLRGDLRYSNRENFSSFNIRFNGGLVQDPIVSALWYGSNGAQYTMPFNGPASYNLGANFFFNVPIAKSAFSISNMARGSWSESSSYVGTNIDTQSLGNPTEDYYGFMENFLAKYGDIDNCSDFQRNTTDNLSITERIRLTYRGDAVEVNVGARTRMNHSWYSITEMAANTTTWNNRVDASVNWTWDLAGLGVKSECAYNWYRGYSTPQESQVVLNAEISKLLFKKKFTLAVKGYDLLGQSRNLTVADASNYHMETINNTLGRYVIVSLTYRFGNFNGNRGGHRGPGPGGHGGPMGPPPGR